MDNILIIAKLKRFKEQPSNNRVLLLEYLSNKKNIKLLNDSHEVSLKRWIQKTKKRINWEPTIIIYYFLSAAREWTSIDIPDFTTSFTDIRRFMIFEDHHYSHIAIPLYKKYNFTKLIKPTKHTRSELDYHNANINFHVWGFYIDPGVFFDRQLIKKYDILLYGFINGAYPLRVKMREVLLNLRQNSNIKIHIIEHPGYYNKGLVSKLPKNEELSKLINQSRFTLVSSSHYRLLLKKYYEVPMSGSTIIGDIPPSYKDILNDKVIEIPFNAEPNNIIKIIQKSLMGEYIHIENNSRKWGKELCNELSFENSYKKLCEICQN
tara:strand:- start:2 stop:964 length:963 start_codon:yes stop_codon:yes gene_type:complete